MLTIKESFAGKKPEIPFMNPSAFKAAPKKDSSKQGSLFWLMLEMERRET
jgi:hypothetical protein